MNRNTVKSPSIWIVLDEVPFVQIASALDALAWARRPDPSAPEPLIEGEPESATWESRDIARGRGHLRYVFFPATRFRGLQLDAPEADIAAFHRQIKRVLPTLSHEDISSLLQSTDVTVLLRGIQAADVLLDPAWIEDLNRLLDHPHKTVAHEARAALAKILSRAAQQGIELIEAIQPGATADVFNAALFTGMASVRQRRQALRWLMQQQTRSNTQIDAVLAAALRDEDWEVRVTAMLAAGRLRATALRPLVETLALPSSLREGVDGQDQRILAAMRAVVLGKIDGGRRTEDEERAALSRTMDADSPRERVRRHIARCVLGLPVDVHDGIFLYCHSLTTPFFETTANQPSTLPPGVERTLDGYRLADIDLIWIPSVTAWLGDELVRPAVANPIRQVTCAGFFIAHTPLIEDGEAVHMSFAEAQARCAALSTRTGASVRLPTADEWEIAARGTDGRRFPWGNALPKPQFEDSSPWGMADATAVHAQWCVDEAGRPLVVGGVEQWRCSMRKAVPSPMNQATLRLVVEWRA